MERKGVRGGEREGKEEREEEKKGKGKAGGKGWKVKRGKWRGERDGGKGTDGREGKGKTTMVHGSERIFDSIKLIVRNVTQGEDVISIATDGL
jgi:hypothetical protein